ncbi:hypothetical protein [Marmoricola sp. RAF53]|uniref:hypothetical protein n=1 Tax=Marmoricola sp. RAF53 TaxID=3233059 RepID=UPI003F97CF79
MTATTTTPRSAAGTPTRPQHTTTGRGWARAGALAGLTGLIGIGASTAVDAVYDAKIAGDAPAIVEKLADQTAPLLVMHTAILLATVLMIPFAAGVKRRLAAQTPAGSLLPDVAAFGLVLVSVAGLMGTALDTEFIFGVNDPDAHLVPEVGVLYGHWVGTVPWLWVGAGVAGVAIAIAALRLGAAPRWIGWVGAVLGGLTLLFGISPLQYMAGFTGPLLVLLLGLGFAFGDRDELS